VTGLCGGNPPYARAGWASPGLACSNSVSGWWSRRAASLALPAAAVARTRQVSIIAVASGVVRFPAMSQGLLPGQQILIGRRDIARAIQVDRGL